MRRLTAVILTAPILLLAACSPVESRTVENLGIQHGMFDTHVVSKSMMRAALKLGDSSDSLQFGADQQPLIDALSNVDKVVVFNKDGLDRDVEDVLIQEIRTGVMGEGSELLMSTSIRGGLLEVYVVEQDGLASRVQAIVRSPYNPDGTRNWPDFGFGDAASSALQAPNDDPFGGASDLLTPKAGLSMIEINGKVDLALLSQFLMSNIPM